MIFLGNMVKVSGVTCLRGYIILWHHSVEGGEGEPMLKSSAKILHRLE